MSCAILATGLCSPLGPADVAAAALRGGLGLGEPLPWAPPLGRGEDAEAAIAHRAGPARPVAAGGRWSALADQAWSELRRGADPGQVDALLLALPLPDPLRWDADEASWDAAVAELLAALPTAAPYLERIGFGHPAPAAALARADERIAAGEWRRVLVLGVDSLLDPLSLAWLAADERLRGPETSLGLAPGEGAAWWLLGRDDGAAIARLHGAGHVPGDGRRAPLDQADRWCAAAAAAGLDLGAPRRDWVDLTGEPWRDRAWGSLLPRLGEGPPPRSPARGWGDLGAATALAAGCAALAGREAGPGRHALWSLGEDGGAGVVVVETAR